MIDDVVAWWENKPMRERINIMNHHFILHRTEISHDYILLLYLEEHGPKFSLATVKALCKKAISDHCRLAISNQPYNDEEEEELIMNWLNTNINE